MGAFIYQWVDLLWLPIGWYAVDQKHRLKTLSFIITCILVLRTQVELIESTGFGEGFLPFIEVPAFTRGLIVYSLAITLFLLLAHFSPRTQNIVFFAAALTIFFFAFVISMVFMLV